MGTATGRDGCDEPMKDKTIIWLAAGGIVFWLIALKPAILEGAFHEINKVVDAILRHF
ncbi:MAG TPA: hypothetical protein VNH83_22940 [Bryobacteraceae bacterium]|nr:hypothetical protein [Bryobacteraceae bacterium]